MSKRKEMIKESLDGGGDNLAELSAVSFLLFEIWKQQREQKITAPGTALVVLELIRVESLEWNTFLSAANQHKHQSLTTESENPGAERILILVYLTSQRCNSTDWSYGLLFFVTINIRGLLCWVENSQTRKMDADSLSTQQIRKALGECRPPASNDKESLKEFLDQNAIWNITKMKSSVPVLIFNIFLKISSS